MRRRSSQRAKLAEEELAEMVKVTPLKEVLTNIQAKPTVPVCDLSGRFSASQTDTEESSDNKAPTQDSKQAEPARTAEGSYFSDLVTEEKSLASRHWRKLVAVALLLLVAKRSFERRNL